MNYKKRVKILTVWTSSRIGNHAQHAAFDAVFTPSGHATRLVTAALVTESVAARVERATRRPKAIVSDGKVV